MKKKNTQITNFKIKEIPKLKLKIRKTTESQTVKSEKCSDLKLLKKKNTQISNCKIREILKFKIAEKEKPKLKL